MCPLWTGGLQRGQKGCSARKQGRKQGSLPSASDRRSRPPLTQQCAPYGRAGYWKLVISVKILRQNSPNTTHMTGLTSFTLPVSTLSTTQVMMANMMPVAME